MRIGIANGIVRTRKGDDEITHAGIGAHLSEILNATLLMVDGTVNIGEISKRAPHAAKSPAPHPFEPWLPKSWRAMVIFRSPG